MHDNIPYTFDFWDDPVVHLLPLNNSMKTHFYIVGWTGADEGPERVWNEGSVEDATHW